MEKGFKKKLRELLFRCKSKEELAEACQNKLNLLKSDFSIIWEPGSRRIYKSLLVCVDDKPIFVEAKTHKNGLVECMKS